MLILCIISESTSRNITASSWVENRADMGLTSTKTDEKLGNDDKNPRGTKGRCRKGEGNGSKGGIKRTKGSSLPNKVRLRFYAS